MSKPPSAVEALLARSHVLGADKRVTNFGGGNTSCKDTMPDPLTGDSIEVVRVKGRNVVQLLLDFASAHNVGHIVIGRSHQPWWRQVFGQSVPLRLVRQAKDVDLHIVSFEEER